jgi:hypothetical protein
MPNNAACNDKGCGYVLVHEGRASTPRLARWHGTAHVSKVPER